MGRVAAFAILADVVSFLPVLCGPHRRVLIASEDAEIIGAKTESNQQAQNPKQHEADVDALALEEDLAHVQDIERGRKQSQDGAAPVEETTNQRADRPEEAFFLEARIFPEFVILATRVFVEPDLNILWQHVLAGPG